MQNNKNDDKILFLPKDYFYKALALFSALSAAILFFFILNKLSEISSFAFSIIKALQPVIVGFVIAYLLNPTANFLYRFFYKLFNKVIKNENFHITVCKVISVTLSILFFVFLIFIAFYLIIPSVIDSITTLIGNAPADIDAITKKINTLLNSNENLKNIIDEGLDLGKKWLTDDFQTIANKWASYFATGVVSVISFLKDFIIGIMVAIYVLFSKRHFKAQGKKILFAFLKPKSVDFTLRAFKKTDKTFGGFINGKIIDSLIIGVLCFLGVTILKMPYPVLVSVIVAVTNVIPVFGPYIGAIPCSLLILIASPIKGLYFIIFIILLQLLDGNLIGPKILGESTGLSAFWVILSILLFAKFFGVLGMIIGVPVFALLYAAFSAFVNIRLQRKNLSLITEDYINMLPDIPDDGDNEK